MQHSTLMIPSSSSDSNPDLQKFLLTNVSLTGRTIGYGTYGSVREVVVAGAICAAKFVRQDVPQVLYTEFLKECQLMSTLRHPNIVQFLGIAYFPEEAEQPALIMERLLTSLDDLLDPETSIKSAYFPISLKCFVFHDVACGLAHLHERSPPITHRDLSARNVLLDSSMVAKISDLGVALTGTRTSPSTGSQIYTPPEGSSPSNGSVDIFAFGIMTMFSISEVYPDEPLPATYIDPETNLLLARTEVQRRSKYMKYVKEKVFASGHRLEDHPLIRLIQQCLHNSPSKRPSIREVLHLLEEARADVRDEHTQLNRLELIQILVKREAELATANRTIRNKEQEICEMRQKLLRESEEHRKKHEDNLKETIRRKEKQIQGLRQQLVKVSKGQKNYNRREKKKIRKLKQRKELLCSREDLLSETDSETDLEEAEPIRWNDPKEIKQQDSQVIPANETKLALLDELQHSPKEEESDSKILLAFKSDAAHVITRKKERDLKVIPEYKSSRESRHKEGTSADWNGEVELWGFGKCKTKKHPIYTSDKVDIDLIELLGWCRQRTRQYEEVNVTDFYESWEDGLAFCAILHSFAPERIPFHEISSSNPHMNFSIAIQAAEDAGVKMVPDIDVMLGGSVESPQSIMKFIVNIYCHFNH